MVIMAYAHAQRSGDTSLLNHYVCFYKAEILRSLMGVSQYDLLRKWADYLVNNTLVPQSQYVNNLAKCWHI